MPQIVIEFVAIRFEGLLPGLLRAPAPVTFRASTICFAQVAHVDHIFPSFEHSRGALLLSGTAKGVRPSGR